MRVDKRTTVTGETERGSPAWESGLQVAMLASYGHDTLFFVNSVHTMCNTHELLYDVSVLLSTELTELKILLDQNFFLH